MDIRIFRLPEVVRMTGLRPSTVYKLIRLKQFPKGIKLSQRSTGWDSRSVEEWVARKISENRPPSSGARRSKGGEK
jgi:prophage regulatory protein